MGIINTISLIIGIFEIITVTLIIFYCKRKLPEKEFNYISYLITYLMGILLIIGAITGSIWFMLLLVLLLASLDYIYRSKRYLKDINICLFG
jgi:flagellar biosynthesis protein FlhB